MRLLAGLLLLMAIGFGFAALTTNGALRDQMEEDGYKSDVPREKSGDYWFYAAACGLASGVLYRIASERDSAAAATSEGSHQSGKISCQSIIIKLVVIVILGLLALVALLIAGIETGG